MKKFILLLCCLMLAGCTKPTEEPVKNTTIFDKAAASTIEKIIISDEQEAKIIRNPKQVTLLLQKLKSLEALDTKPTASESFIEIMYEDQSSEIFTYDDEKVCSSTCASWDKAAIMKLSEGVDTKHIVYAEVPDFLTELFTQKLEKAVIFESCDDEACEAKQLDEQVLYDFKIYLRMLDYGKKADKPEVITDYLQLTTSTGSYLISLSLSDDGFYIGMNDEWVRFNYQDAILSTQLAGYNSKIVKVKNPAYRHSTVFDEGLGAVLEINGYIYNEDTHEFVLEGDKKIIISEAMIQIQNDVINSYMMFSEIAQFKVGQEDVCTYYLNAQESEGCTLDEAKAAYMELQTEINQLFHRMNLNLIDVEAFMLDQKNERFMKQVEEVYPQLTIEKPMLGNVTDLDQYFQELGYTKDEYVYSSEFSDPYLGDVQISYNVKDLLFKVEKENSYAQLRLGSEYGEGVDDEDDEQTVCILDFKRDTVVGECSQKRRYAESGRHLNARHVLIGWQHQLSLSDEELLQYAEMLNE